MSTTLQSLSDSLLRAADHAAAGQRLAAEVLARAEALDARAAYAAVRATQVGVWVKHDANAMRYLAYRHANPPGLALDAFKAEVLDHQQQMRMAAYKLIGRVQGPSSVSGYQP